MNEHEQRAFADGIRAKIEGRPSRLCPPARLCRSRECILGRCKGVSINIPAALAAHFRPAGRRYKDDCQAAARGLDCTQSRSSLDRGLPPRAGRLHPSTPMEQGRMAVQIHQGQPVGIRPSRRGRSRESIDEPRCTSRARTLVHSCGWAVVSRPAIDLEGPMNRSAQPVSDPIHEAAAAMINR